MTTTFNHGDKVEQIKNYNVKASDDDPKYLVESEQTGAEAAHNPDALEKLQAG